MEFDYTHLQIPKFDNEEDFLKDKMYKPEEKKPGDGERSKNLGSMTDQIDIIRSLLNLLTNDSTTGR